MEKIISIENLKRAIVSMEAEQAEAGQILREQFHITYNSFKPVNLIKKTLHDIKSSPNIINNLLGTSTGLATGYVTRKLISGGSVSVVRRIVGTLLQIGVTTLIAKNPEAIKSVGSFLHKHLRRKKDKIS